MPRDGYKGIAFIDDRSFIVCDDGDHVLYLGLLDSDGSRCRLTVIAGQKGVAESVDAEAGSESKCNKPDGPCIDRQNWMCYFCDRGSKTLRSVSLRPPYTVKTLVSVLNVPKHDGEIPTGKIDPLRILLSPTEDAAFIADRRQGYIYKVTGLQTAAPEVYMYHDNSKQDLKLLHGMNWPIAPVHGCNIWDTEQLQWADNSTYHCEPNFTTNHMQTCATFFLVVGGNKAWFIDATHTDHSTNPNYTLACDYAVTLERYQADEGIFLTSNTVLSLNRNSHCPGIWQLTTGSNWSAPRAINSTWIADRGLIAPHGMDLSPSKRLVIVADTGRDKKGALLLARISLSAEDAKVRVHSMDVLEETEQPFADVEALFLNPDGERTVMATADLEGEPAVAVSALDTTRSALTSRSHGYSHLKSRPMKSKTSYEKEFQRKTVYGLSTNTRDSNCHQS